MRRWRCSAEPNMASLQRGWDGQTAGRISPLPLFLRLSIPPTDSLFIPSSSSGPPIRLKSYSPLTSPLLLCSPLALRRGLKMQSFTSLFIHQISEAQNPIEALVSVLMLWMQTSPLPRPLFPEKLVSAKPRVQPNHFQSCANPYTGLKVILEAAKGTRKSL